MLKKILLITITLIIGGCAGIPFCNEKGEPKGCHKWDPATRNGAAPRS